LPSSTKVIAAADNRLGHGGDATQTVFMHQRRCLPLKAIMLEQHQRIAADVMPPFRH
jgi:hypothetical protein